jgi:hypothetical protein
VRHVSLLGDPFKVWLGCGVVANGGVDSEPDGKVHLGMPMGGPSICSGNPTDCIELAFGGMPFNQDECIGDLVDAGLPGPWSFTQSRIGNVTVLVTNCRTAPVDAFMNVLVDWNQDGDWNDAMGPPCTYEWAVKNHRFTAPPGCVPYSSPVFLAGPMPGPAWMRVTVTRDSVPADFPWAGSMTTPTGEFRGGETEDYPVMVQALTGMDDRLLPETLALSVIPNPTRQAVTIRLALPRSSNVSVGVFDITGRRLCSLAEGRMPAGEHALPWNFRASDGAEVPPGIYVVKLRADDRVVSRTMVRVR